MANIYDYLEAGRRVFPLWGIKPDGSCECGDAECHSVGKHPRISNWQHSPHWSDEQIEAMIDSEQFSTGFGVCIDDQLIIDVDPRNGGFESYGKLCANLGLDFKALSGHVVATGGGGWHIEFKRPQAALLQKLEGYPGLDFKSSGLVVGASSLHASGAEYETEKGNPDDLTDAPEPLLDLLRRKDHYRGRVDNVYVDVNDEEIKAYLEAIPCDCDHDTWIKVGMAIHQITSGTGMDLWDDWSNKGDKYPGRHIIDRRWQSFGKASNPVTLGTLIYLAESYGYQSSVTFDPSIPLDDEKRSDGLPFDIGEVDLLRPPGFVGQVTEWINDQCRYPREHLAAAAALVCVGNIAGLRYIDGRDRATLNMLVFARAGSSTGKEAIQDAAQKIHSAVGIGGAVHGGIKSDREIIINLTRNQAAYYIIDEIGIFLKKITNAQERGGASYLEGVIGAIMSVYSKANGNLLLNGDLKEELRKSLLTELSQIKKRLDEESGTDDEGKIRRHLQQVEEAVDRINDGLYRPFLSLIGYTTPVTFDQVMTYENATNGFIGRALLVSEMETNPRPKKKFQPRPMSDQMKMALYNLCSPGCYDSEQWVRVENYAERIPIPTNAEADELLSTALDWFIDYAEDQKGKTGLEAVVRRGYEMMAKISSILAAPEGVRTAEHVRWAFAMVYRDMNEKLKMVETTMLQDSKDSGDLGQALKNRILSIVDSDHSEPLSVIVKRAKSKQFSPGKVKECISAMVASSELVEESRKHPTNGRLLVRYRAP